MEWETRYFWLAAGSSQLFAMGFQLSYKYKIEMQPSYFLFAILTRTTTVWDDSDFRFF